MLSFIRPNPPSASIALVDQLYPPVSSVPFATGLRFQIFVLTQPPFTLECQFNCNGRSVHLENLKVYEIFLFHFASIIFHASGLKIIQEIKSEREPEMQTASHLHSSLCFSNQYRRSYVKPVCWRKLKISNFSPLGYHRGFRHFRSQLLLPVNKLFAIPNTNDGHPSASVVDDDTNSNHVPSSEADTFLSKWSPPGYLWRGLSVLVLTGQVIIRSLNGKIHWRNTLQQLERVGPRSVGVCLLTSAFVGMAFTIQFVREFTRLGLNRSVGGVLALAFSRELSPVVTSVVVAGRIGSAFAAELGTMQVSEQTDTLRVLGANPVDYLVTPRVIASCLALPFLTLMCFTVGMASSAILADAVYGVSINIILDSAQRALKSWDLISAMLKSQVFGAIISVVSCAWGVTTMGGAKGVGESTTSAVVISLVGIFIADFVLSYCFFQGAGDSLKNCV
ncbi:hypothetical protein K2173_019052 [Erythroxylum novogranatense]|uniref:Protein TRIGALACTOSYLDIACYLGLYCEROL 1, chloroplastic n=1 Tax=Erythroxylum novogranatense TaxID=1862640 RepID=A0AAV8STB5_9ROSI|nr:hypothetical protein K2173_019052 [Erythroxylum novogranatense]